MRLVLTTAMLVVVAVMAMAACSGDSGDLDAANERADAAEAKVSELEKQIEDGTAMFLDVQAQLAALTGGSRLQGVRDADVLVCGSRHDVAGYGSLDDSGRNVGFDIDLCRAVAVAVLGDGEKVEVQPFAASERGPALQSGNIDMMARTVTWTTSRDAQWGDYTYTTFYDGQGFMVPKSLGVTSAHELSGAAVCVISGTTTELNMADFFSQNSYDYNPNVFEENDAAREAYLSGACDVFTNDRSQLAAIRSSFPNPSDHVILPETISEEPLTPVVPHGDTQWFDLVKTIMAGLIYAEAYGITSDNIDEVIAGDNAKAKRLLGVEGSFGQESLGLSDTVMQDVHPGRRELRRDIRPQPRSRHSHQPPSDRAQPSLDRRRPDLRSATAVDPRAGSDAPPANTKEGKWTTSPFPLFSLRGSQIDRSR